jgi:UDP-N-acetylglucosamine 1-carboxyvinyltransferase
MKIVQPSPSHTHSDSPKDRPDEERIVILGGVALQGDVQVSGSKNSSLAILAASLLASRGECVLHNVPDISDVATMCDMLRSLGARVERHKHTVTVNAETLNTLYAPEHLVRKMRASVLGAAPLLARLRQA